MGWYHFFLLSVYNIRETETESRKAEKRENEF